jgi:2-polyprenyl-6-methoxyphenol hydroxylase-like FAD-dependent oxidoreductase
MSSGSLARILSICLLLCCPSPARAEVVEADVCVYGGTSGGVAAAVQVARMGKRAVIAEPGRHLGGMTAGGLSAVDIGDPRSVGGIAREYFTKLAGSYGKKLAWHEEFKSQAGGPATGGAFAIEPHTAEALFNQMVEQAKVPIYLNARLAIATKVGPRLVELTMEDGRVFRAKIFLDATYEGDLMAKAGVSYTLEREGNAKYGEHYNGICFAEKFQPRTNHLKPGSTGRVPGGQGVWDRDLPLDPYVVPGDPKSGLLPLVQAGDPGQPGEPAPGVQAYCYRLCLTTAANRVPIAPPKNYDPRRYELVARFIAGCLAMGDDMDLRWFSKHDPLPNDKWDFNTATFGGNMPGASWEWPEASYARRDQIGQEHQDYHRGLLHFLATDPRVPVKVRDQMQRFGLPRDEFVDNGGWPHQLYIREARRMVSDLVMTEHHTFGRQVAPCSMGLGSYGTDTHEIRRIVKDGVVTREGKTAMGRDNAPPYPIGYGTLVPKADQCDNLFVTFAVSASHTAFSSIRMEPVFMVISQSAATAACMAIEGGVPVQKVDYDRLRARLEKDGQILQWQEKKADVAAPAKALADRKSKPRSREPDKYAAVREKLAAAAALSPLPPKSKEPRPTKDKYATVVDNKPVRLATSAKPADVSGKSYDLVVVGATPAGVACAVRAAREGCSVLLVQHNHVLGGMMANGLMQWDALYGGHRAPLFTELLKNIEQHYRETFGDGSYALRTVCYTHQHYPVGWAEPHVAEREFNRLVAGEKRLTLLLKHYPAAVERDEALLRAVTLREYGTTNDIRVQAAIFADATYEGDLAALAKVPCRVGREARDEYREPHAGKVFANIDSGDSPRDAFEGRLNIRPYRAKQGSIDPASPFSADRAVQAYNYRCCVSCDPANRILPDKPANYNREEYVNYNRKSIATEGGPNHKSHMNSPILPGENHDYPEGDWPTREKITRRHLEFALGLMYFLQNDPSVPEAQRQRFREWGLAKDEFLDNGHVPYEMYVRETRRIVGRHVYTEHDNSLAQGFGRTPVQPDSIAITDWYMDSHSCTTDSRPKYHYDGKLILTEESRPGQIPYRSVLPQGIDNLLVPVCLSTTHIAWGAVRLEPVWMETGESAGFAAALAKRHQTTPAKLDPDRLVRTLAERGMLLSFFNDAKANGNQPWIPAAQYFGTKGFLHDYNVRADEPLKRATAETWADGLKKLLAGTLDANACARAVAKAEQGGAATATRGEFLSLLGRSAEPSSSLKRGEALQLMYGLLP